MSQIDDDDDAEEVNQQCVDDNVLLVESEDCSSHQPPSSAAPLSPPPTTTTDEPTSGHKKTWPEVPFNVKRPLSWGSAFYGKWSYSFMNPILQKGRRQFQSKEHLEMADLFQVPVDMKSKSLVTKFWRYYKETAKLRKALWRLAAPDYVPAAYWELVYMVARISLPLSMRELLIIVEQSSPGESISQKALPFVFFLTGAALLGALAQNRMVFLSTKSGIVIRAALTGAIYEHALKLTPTGRSGLTSGEITNLVAVDTQKLYDVMLEGHNLWSCPVLVVVVSGLLWDIVGPEMVVGVFILILFLPIIKVIVSNMLRIRKERSKLTDVRINLLTSMLQGIRVTKLNHYESMLEAGVNKVRGQEMNLLRSELRMWGLVLTTAVSSPLLAFGSAFAFHALVHDDSIILPSDAFSALLLFSILRFPINMTARLVGKAAQALEAVRRIESFLAREIQENEEKKSVDSNQEVLCVNNGSFQVDLTDPALVENMDETQQLDDMPNLVDSDMADFGIRIATRQNFVVSGISLTLKKGQILAIIGKVGCGKTVLLRALLGEIPATESAAVRINGNVAYASQLPFILNSSLRENITFGSAYDNKRFEQAVEACCLGPDIERLGGAGDLTQIGERGVTLSGGQKQRVALARAIYADPDLSLLDDCFSALDSKTGRVVFDNLFSRHGVLRRKATVLVTHALHLLPSVDVILVLQDDGTPSFYGTWNELQNLQEGFDEIATAIKQAGLSEEDDVARRRRSKKRMREGMKESDGIIMSTEEREYGVASFSVWIEWFKRAGGWSFFLAQIALLCFDRGFYVLSDWWIAVWAEAAYDETVRFGRTFPPQSDGRSAQAQYVAVYAVVIVLSVVSTLVRSLWAVSGGARCAEAMFIAMTSRVLRAPMSYFETTPLGRIINRFTYDVEVLDIELSVSMTGLMISSSWLFSSVVVMIFVLPWIILGVIPVAIMYFFIQLYYRMTGPDLQRIDAMSRSPIQASLAEGLEGSTTIRAYQKENRFAESFLKLVDDNSAAMLNFLAAQRWLGFRIEVLGTSMTFACSLIVVCANDMLKISAGLVGLLIQWSVIFSAALNFFFVRLSESEARLTSIERVRETTRLPQEEKWESNVSQSLHPSWPSRGELEFDNVCMRYRKDLPLALESVSFKLGPGTRCGCVGRTGAGKSSLTACIFRLVEIEAGRILLDGVDLAKIGLSDVRGRSNGMRVIPQDPVLWTGTLRECLDPFGQCTNDDMILEALQAVKHKGAMQNGLEALKEKVDEGGSNLSLGERQLLCLARAIVEEPRVLVLDEATSSVDVETDALVQEMLRTKFQNTTLLTIAHRLNTIMDYDVVLVMDNGRAVEFGPPSLLLQDPSGLFSSLVESTGMESARELRAMANTK